MYTLLIVDDEASVVEGLAHTIPWQKIGIDEVRKAYSAFEALEILQTQPVDIMISDITMPRMNGLELVEITKSKWKHIKTILLSGYADFAYAKEAITLGTYEYLLKPVSDEVVLEKVGGAVESLRQERESSETYNRAVQAFRANLPQIRGEFLNQLLQGMKSPKNVWAEKLELLEMKSAIGNQAALMLVRMEDRLTEMSPYDSSIMEYAIGNMADEIFGERFRLWRCRDIHGYLVFFVFEDISKYKLSSTSSLISQEKLPLMKDSTTSPSGFDSSFSYSDDSAARVHPHEHTEENELKHFAAQLQMNVSRYLKGTISVLIGKRGSFPEDVRKLYQDSLFALRRHIGSHSDMFVYAEDEEELHPVRSLQKCYEPPLLHHLLESGSWKQIQEKLEQILKELSLAHSQSQEHVIEAFFFIYSSLSAYAHKNGRSLADIVGASLADVTGLSQCTTAATLGKWVGQVLPLLESSAEQATRSDRSAAVSRMKRFIRDHLSQDISLQAIADHMYMHPVHVSRLFKMETGFNVSDYVLRLKMEQAAELLADHSLKNFEIALKLGYHNPNYFIRVFKKYYSVTPQEYRNSLETGMP
ncbi:response regulator [Paenibacillus sp. Y412MC10]|uniref:response regulator n=1 Tax=Geobacillus sp. (strain Y412MC10) TaxID=481743 RepID=UPI000178A7C6|nr:response regulator [Paenibacillus sp. Y412MC10]ACX65822.1 two component transcriptional regulator, AraC family [Paenibacillus sp. Y412MC10]